jgi:hypothetical protein
MTDVMNLYGFPGDINLINDPKSLYPVRIVAGELSLKRLSEKRVSPCFFNPSFDDRLYERVEGLSLLSGGLRVDNLPICH